MSFTLMDAFTLVSAAALSIGGTSIVVLGLADWLGKIGVNRILEQDKLRYQKELAELKQRYELDLAKSREALQKVVQEHQVVFTNLHTKRFVIIERLYKKCMAAKEQLVDLQLVYQNHSQDPLLIEADLPDEKSERLQEAEQAFSDFYHYFSDNRIYLNERICSIVDTLMARADLHLDQSSSLFGHLATLEDTDATAKDSAKERMRELAEKLQLLSQELTKDFRNILGVIS